MRWFFVFFVCFFIELRASGFTYFIAIKENKKSLDFDQYIPFSPPKGRFYADPFLYKYNGINYLFFEDCDYAKGVISYVVLGQDGKITKPSVALELSTHLSFPCLFQEKEKVYMVPETYRSRAIFLYRSTQFPDHWQRERVLVQGQYFSDPILFKHEGYYWLFTSVKQERLQIFYAKDLQSQFVSHPMNRHWIKGRNAGNVFFADGHMIRPTMDCSKRYGEAIVFKEIVLLTPKEFQEKEIGRIDPTWAPNLVGTHTYCQNEDYIVYDGEMLEEEPEG